MRSSRSGRPGAHPGPAHLPSSGPHTSSDAWRSASKRLETSRGAPATAGAGTSILLPSGCSTLTVFLGSASCSRTAPDARRLHQRASPSARRRLRGSSSSFQPKPPPQIQHTPSSSQLSWLPETHTRGINWRRRGWVLGWGLEALGFAGEWVGCGDEACLIPAPAEWFCKEVQFAS